MVHRQPLLDATKRRQMMSDGVQRDVPGREPSASNADRLDDGTSRLSRKMPASSSANTNRNNCTVLSTVATASDWCRQCLVSMIISGETNRNRNRSECLGMATAVERYDDQAPWLRTRTMKASMSAR